MKRLLSFILALAMLPSLSGCTGFFADSRQIEQLLVVQTMGVDKRDGSVLLSLGSAAFTSAAEGPQLLSASGDSLSSAVNRIFNRSMEDALFCYHINNVILGEGIAEDGIEDFLGYVCRSPIMRIDVPLFVIRGGTAEEAIMQIGDESKGIAEVMNSLGRRFDRNGSGQIYTSSDVILYLKRYGSALICALDCGKSSETDASASSAGEQTQSTEDKGGDTAGESRDSADAPKAAIPYGYAIMRGGKLCSFIEPENTVAVGLLMNSVSTCDVEVRDKKGQLVVLEISEGNSSIKPVWNAPGELKGLDLHVRVSASVLEIHGTGELDDAEYNDHLNAQLELLIAEKINAVLQSAKSLRADFLGLAGKVEQSFPNDYEQMNAEFPDLLPGLRLQVTVSGEIRHTNDLKDE